MRFFTEQFAFTTSSKLSEIINQIGHCFVPVLKEFYLNINSIIDPIRPTLILNGDDHFRVFKLVLLNLNIIIFLVYNSQRME